MTPAIIHPLAFVDDSVTIGAGSVVRQFVSVTRGTVLGEACSVAPGAHLDGPRFGNRCVIGHNVAMGPGFVFGDDCFVGPGVVLCNDAWPAAHKVGWEYDMLADGRCVAVRAGNGVGIGANAVVLPGVKLGDGSFVAAGAVCGRDVRPGHLFKRDGSIVEINTAWTRKRMKAA